MMLEPSFLFFDTFFHAMRSCLEDTKRASFNSWAVQTVIFLFFDALPILCTILGTPASTAERCSFIEFQHPFSHHISFCVVQCKLRDALMEWSMFLLTFNRESSKPGSVCFNAEAEGHDVDAHQGSTPPGEVKSCTWTSERPQYTLTFKGRS
jgi:hypothetical protein